MKSFIIYIIKFIIYIIKAYLLVSISTALFTGIAAWFLYDPAISTHYDMPPDVVIIAALLIPPFDILVFILLSFHKFNALEIIIETCLFILLPLLGPFYNNGWHDVILMVLIMGAYIVIKRYIVKKIEKPVGEIKE